MNPTSLYSCVLPIFKVFVLVLLAANLSLNQILLIFFLYVGQTWKRDSITLMHGLASLAKEILPFVKDMFFGNTDDSYLFSNNFTFFIALLLYLSITILFFGH